MACCRNTDSDRSITQWKDLENDHNSLLSLKPSSNLELLVNQINNATPEKSNDPEKISSSKYYDTEEMQSIEMPHKNKSLYLFHIYPYSLSHLVSLISICSLIKSFDDFQHLLSSNKTKFEIMAISETRITK